jgi:CMP-N,N'-diacetyllegionaminic acid synthase
MNILAIIPARSGSKGVKNKNIIPLIGKPLIYFSIKQVLSSKMITDFMVSTDSKKIANISKKYSAPVPFLRPKNISGDKSLISETLFFCLKKMEKIKKKKYQYIILIQPSAPNRKNSEIDNAIKKIIKTKSEVLISLTKVDEPHPYKLKKIKNGMVKNFLNINKGNHPRQTLPKVYKPSGNIYIFKRKLIIKKNLNSSKQTFQLVNQKDFLNIDNHDDLILAKIKMQIKK